MLYNHLRTAATFLAASACLPSLTTAWYLEVHNQIGYVADQLLNANTQYMLNSILEPKYEGSVGRAASWADTVSRTTAKYSYGWHWISAKDNPPDECGLYYHRDCQEGGCVVQQIHNQTRILEGCVARLRHGRYYPDVDCQQALMWVIHFIMDVCEPMHTSLRDYGGNTFKVKFNGEETNMHQTWDRWILYSQTNHDKGFSADQIDPYFQGLYNRIRSDSFRIPVSEWAMCSFDIHRGTYCPERWAKDSNAIVCDYAYGRYVNGSDLLLDGYAKGAFHIVENQLAKAAWRTAGWLNSIASSYLGSSYGAEVEGVEMELPGVNNVDGKHEFKLPGPAFIVQN